MNILVTGGAGFIASHIVDAYLAAGHGVAVVDDLSSGSMENVNPKAKFYRMDIRSADIGDVMRTERVEVLCHHAAQIDVRRSVARPDLDASINVLGGLNLFEHARACGVRKVVFASTGGAIYGEQDYFPADELHPLRPLSPYGITKLCTEKYLSYYHAVHGLDSVVLRYANVYGPRQNPHGEAGVVAIFAQRLLRGETPIINGDGAQTRDYTYVADIVRANILALGCVGAHIYNVGTGIESDVNTVFRSLRDALGASCPEQHGPAKLGEQQRSVISARLIERELGWRPSVTLTDGLRMTAEYFKAKA